MWYTLTLVVVLFLFLSLFNSRVFGSFKWIGWRVYLRTRRRYLKLFSSFVFYSLFFACSFQYAHLHHLFVCVCVFLIFFVSFFRSRLYNSSPRSFIRRHLILIGAKACRLRLPVFSSNSLRFSITVSFIIYRVLVFMFVFSSVTSACVLSRARACVRTLFYLLIYSFIYSFTRSLLFFPPFALVTDHALLRFRLRRGALLIIVHPWQLVGEGCGGTGGCGHPRPAT